MDDAQARFDFGGNPTAGAILDRIRAESRDESEKGRWFEQLFMRVALQRPEFEIEAIWRWPDWPEREALTGLDGRDIGIDLVARRTSGEWVAIQCKCYEEGRTLGKGEIDKFLGGSQQPVFRLRWIVATCRWGPNAERAIMNAHPQVTQIDFRQLLGVQVEERDAKRPVQEPWPLQLEAIEDAVAGLENHDRGRLVMACGTGKTFTALRIAEQVVEDGGRILFAAPTIALVSQARREWLRQTTRKLNCIVVCSDQTAGGRNENEDIRVSELECPVSTDPAEIAGALDGDGITRVVFCTYHSLGRVTESQAEHGAASFPHMSESIWPSPTSNDMTRVLGVSLAVNGVTEGKTLEQPGKLPRTMAFSNTILRSKWYAQALMESEVLRATTRRMADGRAMRVAATHLDASASALQRNQELRTLGQAERDGECRIVCNVKLFTEGVDVPSLDAVAFLDPRDSQVDVVQAVGRVMRKAPGKRFGYIIVPVVVEPGSDVAAALMRGTEGYQTVGRVLRALQAHDGRLAESPANFVKVYEQSTRGRAPRDTRSEVRENRGEYQIQLDLKEAEQGIYAHVAAASGPDVGIGPRR